MSKEYRISELMENYTDNELFLEGEQTVDTDKAVGDLLAQVRPKKKMKPLFKGLVAAAAAVVVLAGAVTATTLLTGSYTTITGRHMEWEFDRDDEGGIVSGWAKTTTMELEDVLTLQDGRLYFNINGESTDVTDLIDRTTPYIYTYELPESEKPAYVIIGGTPEEFAVVDLVHTKDTGWFGVGIINGDALGSSVDIWINRNLARFGEMEYHKYNGYYWSDNDFTIDYRIWDSDWHTTKGYSYYVTNFFPTWRDDADAWLVEALLQLELIRLPKIEDFDLDDVTYEDDRVFLWDQDLTELVSEEKAVSRRMWWSDKGEEKSLIIGGTPGNFGWAFVQKRLLNDGSFEYWTIAEENVADDDGQLREWYVSAAERNEYDLEQLRQNYYFDNE